MKTQKKNPVYFVDVLWQGEWIWVAEFYASFWQEAKALAQHLSELYKSDCIAEGEGVVRYHYRNGKLI